MRKLVGFSLHLMFRTHTKFNFRLLRNILVRQGLLKGSYASILFLFMSRNNNPPVNKLYRKEPLEANRWSVILINRIILSVTGIFVSFVSMIDVRDYTSICTVYCGVLESRHKPAKARQTSSQECLLQKYILGCCRRSWFIFLE